MKADQRQLGRWVRKTERKVERIQGLPGEWNEQIVGR